MNHTCQYCDRPAAIERDGNLYCLRHEPVPLVDYRDLSGFGAVKTGPVELGESCQCEINKVFFHDKCTRPCERKFASSAQRIEFVKIYGNGEEE